MGFCETGELKLVLANEIKTSAKYFEMYNQHDHKVKDVQKYAPYSVN